MPSCAHGKFLFRCHGMQAPHKARLPDTAAAICHVCSTCLSIVTCASTMPVAPSQCITVCAWRQEFRKRGARRRVMPVWSLSELEGAVPLFPKINMTMLHHLFSM